MIARLRTLGMLIALLVAAVVPLKAEEPANYTYAPAPPGTIVQSQVVYLAGQAMHSQWRAVLSKKVVGQDKAHGKSFYQWYLSIYQIDGTTYHLQYQSPRDGGPFQTVEQAHGAPMWFPAEDGKIVGGASLVQSGVENLVVQSTAVGADCGMAMVSVFGAQGEHVKMLTKVQNPCGLSAAITHKTSGLDTLTLTGPYYAKDAPLCCPTKAKVTTMLHFMDGRWMTTPAYFTPGN